MSLIERLRRRENLVSLEKIRVGWHMTDLEKEFLDGVIHEVIRSRYGDYLRGFLVGGRALSNPRWLNGKLVKDYVNGKNWWCHPDILRASQVARRIGISRLPFNELLLGEWKEEIRRIEFSSLALKSFLLGNNPLMFADIDVLLEYGGDKMIHWPISSFNDEWHTQVVDCFVF